MSGEAREIHPKPSVISRVDSYHFDERFYVKTLEDGRMIYQPSVTYIIGCAYPQDFELARWRGDVGNKRADEIFEEAGVDGSYVHDAIEGLLAGHEVTGAMIDEKFSPKRSLKVKRCLKAFVDWHNKYQPKTIKTESFVWSDGFGFAGTLDYLCEIDGETYLIDFKTSKTLHDSHKVQVCAYGLAEEAHHVALLHLGNTTKARYTFKVLTDEERQQHTREFIETNKLFQTLNPNAAPNTETFPNVFTLGKAA